MKPKKPYWEMNLEELREATKEFDKEMPGLPGKPLTPAMRRKLADARRRAKQTVSVVLEPALLKKVDAAAHKLRMTRAELIVEGLNTFLKRAS